MENKIMQHASRADRINGYHSKSRYEIKERRVNEYGQIKIIVHRRQPKWYEKIRDEIVSTYRMVFQKS